MAGCSCLPNGTHNDPHPWIDSLCAVHGAGAQPLPTGNDLPVAHREVMKMLQERLDLGVDRYGQPLQPYNGRKPLRDALEEALDMCVYLWCAWYESENPPTA